MAKANGQYKVVFRTMANGSYKWMLGLRRGYYHLLWVPEGARTNDLRSKGVKLIESSPAGLLGVTEKSAYYIEHYRERLENRADELNAAVAVAV